MSIKARNKIDAGFSASSMSDLVFLLLIFFMITSTLVSPNAIKLLLPSSNSQTVSPRTMSVYIKANAEYFIEQNPVKLENLEVELYSQMIGQPDDGTIVIRADKESAVQLIVNVIDAVNRINEKNNKKYKVILATKPQE